MTDVRYERATLEHAAALAAVMRPADAAEVLAATGETGLSALERGVLNSYVCVSVFFDGAIAMMFGLMKGVERSAVVERVDCCWFLTGEAAGRHPRTLIRTIKRLHRECLDIHPTLYNWVDERYAGAIWLLRHLGVELSEPVPYGVGGELFRLGIARGQS